MYMLSRFGLAFPADLLPGLGNSSRKLDRKSGAFMDVLSEVLRAVRLSGAVFFDLDVRAPWAVASPVSSEVRERVMPDSENLIPFHFVMEGNAWLQTDLPGFSSIPLGKG